MDVQPIRKDAGHLPAMGVKVVMVFGTPGIDQDHERNERKSAL